MKENSLDGSARIVHVLNDVDSPDQMAQSIVNAIFVVGSEDGLLAVAMKDMASGFGKGAEYALIEGAGHFSEVVIEFLDKH